MMQINKRSIGICILLSFVTCGIYLIYWEYLLVKNVKALKNDTSGCAGEMACLLFVPFYSYYWWFTRGKTVKDEFSAKGIPCTGNEIAYLLLWIFGLGLVAVAIMQNDFNSFPSNICETRTTADSDALAVISMICGILGLILYFVPIISIAGSIVAIVGIITGAISLKKGAAAGYHGMAIAGLVCGIIAVAIWLWMIISLISFEIQLQNYLNSF